jgi:putative ABC transport system permease protein
VLFGLAPAWLNARPDVADTLKETARGAMHPRSHRFRSALLVAQVALAMVLLVGAGLMIRTLSAMNAVNLGLQPRRRAHAPRPLEGSRSEPRVAAFWRDLVKSVEALPGVRSASVARGLPIESWSGQYFVNQDHPDPPAGHVPDANYVVVGPRYFETMQIPLRSGRASTTTTRRAACPLSS